MLDEKGGKIPLDFYDPNMWVNYKIGVCAFQQRGLRVECVFFKRRSDARPARVTSFCYEPTEDYMGYSRYYFSFCFAPPFENTPRQQIEREYQFCSWIYLLRPYIADFRKFKAYGRSVCALEQLYSASKVTKIKDSRSKGHQLSTSGNILHYYYIYYLYN